MLFAEPLSYVQSTTSGGHILSIVELQQIGAIAGQKILSTLDHKLRLQKLAKSSKQDLEALFLVVFSPILAVGYTAPTMNYPAFPSTQVLCVCSYAGHR